MRRSLLLLIGPAVLVAVAAPAVPAAARANDALEDCVAEQSDRGKSQTEALAYCKARIDDDGGLLDPDRNDQPDRTTADGGGDGGLSPLVAVLVGVAALGAGLGVGFGLGRSRRAGAPAVAPSVAAPPLPPSPVASAAAPPPPAPPPSRDPGPAGRQRRLLVVALIDLRDRLQSEALRTEIGAKLAEVGVTEIVVGRGELFDAQRHRGVDAEDTDDAALDQKVAATERPGFLDGDVVIRPPDVVVFRRRA